MSVPERMAALLADVDQDQLPGVLTIGRECVGAQFHSPTPLVVHETRLVPDSWDPTITKMVWLCGTCADNLAIFRLLLWDHSGVLPWAVRREFGNTIRALGITAWETYQKKMGR